MEEEASEDMAHDPILVKTATRASLWWCVTKEVGAFMLRQIPSESLKSPKFPGRGIPHSEVR